VKEFGIGRQRCGVQPAGCYRRHSSSETADPRSGSSAVSLKRRASRPVHTQSPTFHRGMMHAPDKPPRARCYLSAHRTIGHDLPPPRTPGAPLPVQEAQKPAHRQPRVATNVRSDPLRSPLTQMGWEPSRPLVHQLGGGRAQLPRQVRMRPTSYDSSTHKKGAVLGCAGRLQRNVGFKNQSPDEAASLKLSKAVNDAANVVLV
jgi:hypothetical protein